MVRKAENRGYVRGNAALYKQLCEAYAQYRVHTYTYTVVDPVQDLNSDDDVEGERKSDRMLCRSI